MISETTVYSDQKEALIKKQVRLAYLERFIPIWLKERMYIGYAVMLAWMGFLMLFRIPVLSVAAFAAAAYFYKLHKFNKWIWTRPRTLITAD